MFEDRSRRNKKSFIFIFILFMLILAGLGYFLSYDDFTDITINDKEKDNKKIVESKNSGLKIPESLLSSSNDSQAAPVKQISNIPTDKRVTPSTVFHYKLLFSLCNHTRTKMSIQAPNDDINMLKEDLEHKYSEWKLESFSPDKVVFLKSINTYCPEHYIIGVNGDRIVVFKYNIDGQKYIHYETDIQLSTLMPEDQETIRSGIVADTENELQEILEGLSD